MSGYAVKNKSFCVAPSCGECLFFKKPGGYEKPCVELGVHPDDETCDKYSLNWRKLGKSGANIAGFMEVVRTARDNNFNTQLLPLLFVRQPALEKAGFYIGQKVWLKNTKTKHLYYAIGYKKGFLTAVSATGTTTRVPKENVTTKNPFK